MTQGIVEGLDGRVREVVASRIGEEIGAVIDEGIDGRVGGGIDGGIDEELSEGFEEMCVCGGGRCDGNGWAREGGQRLDASVPVKRRKVKRYVVMCVQGMGDQKEGIVS